MNVKTEPWTPGLDDCIANGANPGDCGYTTRTQDERVEMQSKGLANAIFRMHKNAPVHVSTFSNREGAQMGVDRFGGEIREITTQFGQQKFAIYSQTRDQWISNSLTWINWPY